MFSLDRTDRDGTLTRTEYATQADAYRAISELAVLVQRMHRVTVVWQHGNCTLGFTSHYGDVAGAVVRYVG